MKHAQILNMTGHKIDICDEERTHELTIPPCGFVVRAAPVDTFEENLHITRIGYRGDLELPVWKVGFGCLTFTHDETISYTKPDAERVHIVASKIACDKIISLESDGHPIWEYMEDSVKSISVVTVHKTQRDGSTIYGALGFALQGQIGR